MGSENEFSFVDWVAKRVRERTTLDGVMLIGLGVAIMLFRPLVPWIAWAAIAFGAWTVWKPEKRG